MQKILLPVLVLRTQPAILPVGFIFILGDMQPAFVLLWYQIKKPCSVKKVGFAPKEYERCEPQILLKHLHHILLTAADLLGISSSALLVCVPASINHCLLTNCILYEGIAFYNQSHIVTRTLTLKRWHIFIYTKNSKVFFQFKIIINVLVSSFRILGIPMC